MQEMTDCVHAVVVTAEPDSPVCQVSGLHLSVQLVHDECFLEFCMVCDQQLPESENHNIHVIIEKVADDSSSGVTSWMHILGFTSW